MLNKMGKGMKEMTEAQMVAALRAKGYSIRAPELIQIGGIHVPKPLMTPPPIGTRYWRVVIDDVPLTDGLTWDGCEYDKIILNRRMLHLTKENAVAHAKALIKVSGGTCE